VEREGGSREEGKSVRSEGEMCGGEGGREVGRGKMP